jgi:membrane protease YdiL (CAAX protease family)
MSLYCNKFIFRGEIFDPPRSSRLGGVLLILLIAGLALAQVLSGHPWGRWVFCAAALILPIALVSGSIHTVHFNIFLLSHFLTDLFPHPSIYPFKWLTELMLYTYVVMLIPTLRGTVGWLRAGKLNAKVWLTLMAVAVLAVVALRGWVRDNSPDLSRYTGMLPNLPFGVLLVYGVAFAAFNAALEEITWRGVMMEALDSAFGAGYLSLVIQALSFGAAHYQSGFPNGIPGTVITFVGGLLLGIIRRKSRGMLGCWIVHFFGDMVVFSLILSFVSKSGN